MGDATSAPTTRWPGRRSADGRPPLDNDEVVWHLAGMVAGLAVGIVLLPALALGTLLAALWSVRGWSRRWLLRLATAVALAAWPFADPLLGVAVGAAADLVSAEGRDGSAWLRVLAATSPASVVLGAVSADGWLTWQQLRAELAQRTPSRPSGAATRADQLAAPAQHRRHGR